MNYKQVLVIFIVSIIQAVGLVLVILYAPLECLIKYFWIVSFAYPFLIAASSIFIGKYLVNEESKKQEEKRR